MTLDQCLFEEALDDAIKARDEHKEAIKEHKEKIKSKVEEGWGTEEELIQRYPPPQVREHLVAEKHYVVCLDTMG